MKKRNPAEEESISSELKQTLDEHIGWVNAACELAINEGFSGIKCAIDALEDDQLRGMLFVMVSTRAQDVETLRESVRDHIARQQFESLEGDGKGPVLN